jgi:hypothetical protein
LRRSKEQSLIDGFFNHLRKYVESEHRKFVKCSMDGFDAVLGADYIFSDNVRFLMTEFKYDEADLKKESDKPRRLKLCKILDHDVLKSQQSLRCHYIAWSRALPENKRRLYFNQYQPQICNQVIWGVESELKNTEPNEESQRSSRSIIMSFVNNDLGVPFKLFDHYVSWLISLNGDDDSGVEILIDDPDSDELDYQGFDSLQQLKDWLDLHAPKPEQTNEPDDPEPENNGPRFRM